MGRLGIGIGGGGVGGGGGGGGNPTIGNSVVNSDPHRVLFTDENGDLAQSENITFDEEGISGAFPEFKAKTFTGAVADEELDVGGEPEDFIAIFNNSNLSNNGFILETNGTSTFQELVDDWNAANPSNTITVIEGGDLIPDDDQEIEFFGASQSTIGNFDPFGFGVTLTGTHTMISDEDMIISGYLPLAGGYVAGMINFNEDIFNLYLANEQGLIMQAEQGNIMGFADENIMFDAGDNVFLQAGNSAIHLDGDRFNFSSSGIDYTIPDGPQDGYVLAWDDNADNLVWAPQGGGGGLPTLNSFQMIVGDEFDGTPIATPNKYLQAGYNDLSLSFRVGDLDASFLSKTELEVYGFQGNSYLRGRNIATLSSKESELEINTSDSNNRNVAIRQRVTNTPNWQDGVNHFDGSQNDLQVSTTPYTGRYDEIQASIITTEKDKYVVRVDTVTHPQNWNNGDTIEIRDEFNSLMVEGDLYALSADPSQAGTYWLILDNVTETTPPEEASGNVVNNVTQSETANVLVGLGDNIDLFDIQIMQTEAPNDVVLSAYNQPFRTAMSPTGPVQYINIGFPMFWFDSTTGHDLGEGWDFLISSSVQNLFRAGGDGTVRIGADGLGNRDASYIQLENGLATFWKPDNTTLSLGNGNRGNITMPMGSDAVFIQSRADNADPYTNIIVEPFTINYNANSGNHIFQSSGNDKFRVEVNYNQSITPFNLPVFSTQPDAQYETLGNSVYTGDLELAIWDGDDWIISGSKRFSVYIEFDGVTDYTFTAPEDMEIIDIEVNNNATVDVEVNSASYTLGDPIDRYDTIDVGVDVDCLVTLVCKKIGGVKAYS